jgi:hypothetical protein
VKEFSEEVFDARRRLGYAALSIDSTLVGPLGTTTAEATGWDLIYGVGVAFKVGQSFGLRAEWKGWDSEDSLEACSIGAYFRFGKRWRRTTKAGAEAAAKLKGAE